MTDTDFYEFKKTAITRLKEVAGEHFDGFVFIGRVVDPDTGDSASISTWDGGFNQALGLTERLKERFRQEIISADFPDDPKPDEDWKES